MFHYLPVGNIFPLWPETGREMVATKFVIAVQTS